MTDRDRLVADLTQTFRDLGTRSDPTAKGDGWPAYQEHRDEAVVLLVNEVADRLIAFGWTRNMSGDDLAYTAGREDGLREAIDEDRLARALQWAETPVGATLPPIDPFIERAAAYAEAYRDDQAAAIAEAYREDTDAEH